MEESIINIFAELILVSTFIWFSYWTFPIRGILSLCLFYIFGEAFMYHHYEAFTIYVIWYVISFIFILKIRKSYINSTFILYIWYVFSSFVLHCIPCMTSFGETNLSSNIISCFASILLFVDWYTLKRDDLELRGYILDDITSIISSIFSFILTIVNWYNPKHRKKIQEEKLMEIKLMEIKLSLKNILTETINKYNIIENIYNKNIKVVLLTNLLESCTDSKNKINDIYANFCKNIDIPQQYLDEIVSESDTYNKFNYIVKLKNFYIDKMHDTERILSDLNNQNKLEINSLYNKYCNTDFTDK